MSWEYPDSLDHQTHCWKDLETFVKCICNVKSSNHEQTDLYLNPTPTKLFVTKSLEMIQGQNIDNWFIELH